ncbi:FAD-binding domain-containing protein [Coniochaeta ligniaria NRRL 30616]|uniref:FAD-binding domain-containing protein n=1 Tax=Coniochaeta ligniaria NRRL 30616 TaxID=1408157 RepID=A0A1J7IF79_9PEZI|nr:FAD-binding domain-containing protein [Coniochaeta ligniaria NRRL 30616]
MVGKLAGVAVALAAGFVLPAYAASIETLFGPYMSPGTEIAASTEANFSGLVTPRWTTWETPNWTGAIKPETEADLQNIVKIAKANNISFLATNGGHGAGICYGTISGIDINLSNFNSVSIDVANNELTIGAGVKIGDIIQPLYDAGKAVPHGNTDCVGMIGATLGAGIGIGTGIYGLGIDSLKSVRLVTASGDLVTASRTSHPELFWAIRGAGANFGIVASAKFQLQDQVNNGNVVRGAYTFPGSANRSVFELYKSFDDFIPPELSLQLGISYSRATGTSQIALTYFYFGPLSGVQPYLDAAAALGPTTNSTSILTQPALYNSLQNGECTIGSPISGGTLGLGKTDVPTLQAVFAELVAFNVANPTTYVGQSVFQRYDNKLTLQTPSYETVYPWRDIKTFWLHLNFYLSPALEEPAANLTKSMRAKLQATSGFATPHVYVNYAYGDEGPAAWWSLKNLPKLVVLKALWDPKKLFGKANPVSGC